MIEAFIFLPQGQPTNARKELDPSLGSIILKLTFVDIPLIMVSTFFQTPIGSIRPWLDSFRYISDSYSWGLPSCSQVSWVMMFTCDSKSSTTCRTWYPSISKLTSGSASLLSFWFRLQISLFVFRCCCVLFHIISRWIEILSYLSVLFVLIILFCYVDCHLLLPVVQIL